MARKQPEFTVIVDTREQTPYSFPQSVVAKLDEGDYSIEGMQKRVAIERKELSDCYGSCGAGRKRFEREVERLAALEYAAIVVESTLEGLHVRPPFVRRMSGAAVRETLISWSIRYGVHIWFAGNRRAGNALTYSLLEKFWRYHASQETTT